MEDKSSDPKLQGRGQSCEVCTEAPSRYCCPACRIRTCSLKCVKAHKASSGCTGTPSVTEYKALKKFTDADLLKDIRFLEQGSRLVDIAGRLAPSQRRKRQRTELPFRLEEIVRQAKERGIEVEFMAAGMSRRKKNKTYFHRKKKELTWSVGLDFVGVKTDVFIPNVSENSSFIDMLRSFFESSNKHEAITRELLKEFRKVIESGGIVEALLVSESTKGGKEERKINVQASLGEVLKGGYVIEYPRFKISLPDSS